MNKKNILTDKQIKTYKELAPVMYRWQCENFGKDQDPFQALRGIGEELGEMTHAILKSEQGIRGSKEELWEKRLDAIGDLQVFFFNYLSSFDAVGLTLQRYREGATFKDPCEVSIGEGHSLEREVESELWLYYAFMRVKKATGGPPVTEAAEFLHGVVRYCFVIGVDPVAILKKTFEEVVAKRDWKRKPVGVDEEESE